MLSHLCLLNQSINYYICEYCEYMNIAKVKKRALISPKDTHVKAEYLKNSLSSLYWDKISDEY